MGDRPDATDLPRNRGRSSFAVQPPPQGFADVPAAELGRRAAEPLRGWLIVAGVWLVLEAVRALWGAAQWTLTRGPATFALMGQSVGAVVLLVIVVVYPLALLAGYFRRRLWVPKAVGGWLIINAAAWIYFAVAFGKSPNLSGPTLGIAWTLYFLFSARVKKTFVL